jgi:RNA polymerase-interacting CarD/CdnL/TRCF family regulator
VRLAVGDAVVYGPHGAGTVVARSTRDIAGESRVVIMLALAGDLSIELPLARAEEHLRPVADETELKRVQEVLSTSAEPSEMPWLKRREDALAKMTTTAGLAEVIRDARSREAAGVAISPSEREVLKRALDLLTNEIALARDVEPAEAGAWIDRQLG